jgi:hypothetical protein
MVEMAAENVEGGSIANCGHFVPEESPDEIVRHVLAMRKKFATPLYPFVHKSSVEDGIDTPSLRPSSRILVASSRDRLVCRHTRLRVGSWNDFSHSSDPMRRYSTN